MAGDPYLLKPIGVVQSPLVDAATAPKQGDEGSRMQVRNLEALDGTPVLDVKPVLRGVDER